jgi:ABC-type polysaccharide/polyol phosphate export permease
VRNSRCRRFRVGMITVTSGPEPNFCVFPSAHNSGNLPAPARTVTSPAHIGGHSGTLPASSARRPLSAYSETVDEIGGCPPWRDLSAHRTVRGSWQELWRGRELIGFFALRDLKVRYRQAVLGVAWVLAQPLAMVVVFTLVFHRLAGVPGGDVPYPLFAMVGLVIWTCFSSTVTAASDSLVSNSALVTKVYFPRLTAPTATLLPPLVDLAVSLVVVAAMTFAYAVRPTWRLIGAPLWLLMLAVTAIGVGLWLSALNVRYRDVRHAVLPLLQVLLFVSPVAYAPALSPRLDMAYATNPLVGVIGLGRWSLLASPWPGWPLLVSAGVALALMLSGLWYFQHAERAFADVI